MSKQFEHFDGWGHGALCLYVDQLESLAREAGAALLQIKNVSEACSPMGLQISPNGLLTAVEPILTKLDAAGLLEEK